MADADKIASALTALYTHMDAFAYVPAPPVSMPQPATEFVVPEDGKYLVVQPHPNLPRWVPLKGPGRLDQGLLTILVIWPTNDGLIRPMLLAGAVAAHFRNQTLFSGGFKVTIGDDPWVSASLDEPSRVSIPVTIPWQAS
jgi:hypothetical protein